MVATARSQAARIRTWWMAPRAALGPPVMVVAEPWSDVIAREMPF